VALGETAFVFVPAVFAFGATGAAEAGVVVVTGPAGFAELEVLALGAIPPWGLLIALGRVTFGMGLAPAVLPIRPRCAKHTLLSRPSNTPQISSFFILLTSLFLSPFQVSAAVAPPTKSGIKPTPADIDCNSFAVIYLIKNNNVSCA
jgi:hypothetical protein